MCIAAITVYLGKKGELRPQKVACHECWQCREQAITDWQGRNIAETLTAKACHAVTLTYGRDENNSADHIRMALLTYSDVQKFLKLLRRHGFPVRYFVTGEYGSAKGRAHWHIMLYWLDGVPPGLVLDDERFMFARYNAKTGEQATDENGDLAYFWPHGYAFFTEPRTHSVRYNCKYILKDTADELAQRKPGMSKLPPLGAEYFAQMAGRYVEQGLAPQGAGREEWANGDLMIGGFEYRFPGVTRTDKHGVEHPVLFRLKDRSLELFLESYVRQWRARHGDLAMPASRLVEEFVEPGTWKTGPATAKPLTLREMPPVTEEEKAKHLAHLAHVRDLQRGTKNVEEQQGQGWSDEDGWYYRDESIRAAYAKYWRDAA